MQSRPETGKLNGQKSKKPETRAMPQAATSLPPSTSRDASVLPALPLNDAYHMDENKSVEEHLALLSFDEAATLRIKGKARQLIQNVRDNRRRFGGLDRFLNEFGLTTREGIALMCLAEALLRIPDSETADKMIRDKIGGAEWDKHIGKADSLFVNASTWALMLTGKVIADVEEEKSLSVSAIAGKIVSRVGEPVVRQAMLHAMKIMGQQFVMGRSIGEALLRAEEAEKTGYRHSYDMLGEGARTAADAQRYFDAYDNAIHSIGKAAMGRGCIEAPGISVKLSALHPRYEYAKRHICVPDLSAKLLKLAQKCAQYNIGLTVDAEEAHRLEISLEIIANVFRDPSLKGWNGFGLAVQAYQKRCTRVLDILAALCEETGQRMMVRLVKGAYWDSEIKYAQVNGLPGYPVFTRKNATDVSYLANAAKMLRAAMCFIRCSPRITPIPSPPSWKWPAPTRAVLNSSVCTAWANRCITRLQAAATANIPAASTRLSAAIRTCCPIWCAACWKTGRIPTSSTACKTTQCRLMKCCKTLSNT